MTGITNTRHAHLQELRIIAAVRFVAVRAVFHHGRVLPKKWSTALGMTGQAVLVDSALYQLTGIRRAMWVVAAGASDLTLAIGHVRRTLQLRPSHDVALQSQLWLLLLYPFVFCEGGVKARVRGQRDLQLLFNLVAIHARHASRFVRATLPKQM